MTLTDTRLKFLASGRVTNGLGEAGEYDDPDWPRYIRTTDIAGPRSLRDDTFVSLPPVIARRAPVRRGDILMTAVGATVGKTILYESDQPACYAGYLVRFRPSPGVEPRFISYWTETPLFLGQIEAGKVRSTIDNFSASKYANLKLRIPSLVDQRNIADALDRETVRIDALIERESRMVEILSERFETATLSLVTSGLRPFSCARDSGIGLLGTIPTHWRTVRNKTFMREIADLSQTGNEELLTVSHITGVTPRAEKEVNMFMAESLEGYKRVVPGDLVINTMWAWMGALGVSPHSGVVSPAYGVYRIDPLKADPAYLDALFRSRPYISEMTRYSRGVWSSRLRLYPDVFLSLSTPLPPLDEQQEIAKRIEEMAHEHDRIKNRLERAIALLKERRQALITAAITGEIGLSEVA